MLRQEDCKPKAKLQTEFKANMRNSSKSLPLNRKQKGNLER